MTARIGISCEACLRVSFGGLYVVDGRVVEMEYDDNVTRRLVKVELGDLRSQDGKERVRVQVQVVSASGLVSAASGVMVLAVMEREGMAGVAAVAAAVVVLHLDSESGFGRCDGRKAVVVAALGSVG
jgi:hypothetical protein